MKLNVMKDKPKITDEEIQSYMDFDRLMEVHSSSTSFFTKGKIISATIILATVATVVYFSKNNSETAPNALKKIEIQTQTSNNSQATVATSDSLTKANPVQKIEQPEKKEATSASPIANPKIETAPAQKDVFVEAEPIDGFPKLYNFFNQNLKYPDTNLKDKIEGVEIVSFVIDENGNVSAPKIVQSLGKSFDDEALRLLNTMPKWKPATLNGRAVPTKLSMPFTFSISK